MCRTGVERPYDECQECRLNPSNEIHSISISPHGGPLHDRLAKYKRSPDPDVREQCTTDLAVILAVFLRNHTECLLTGIDVVLTIPPSNQDAGVHDIAARLRLFQLVDRARLDRDKGTSAFTTPKQVAGKRVLLLDDTFTRGGTMFSALRAIAQARPAEVAPLVIGRHFQPSYADNEQIRRQLVASDFDESRCGSCSGFILDPPLRDPQHSLET